MATFSYTCINAQGKHYKGKIEAATVRGAREQLRAQGLLPLIVTEINAKPHRFLRLNSNAVIKPAMLALISRQLAALLQSGTPIDEALNVVAGQMTKPQLAEVLNKIRMAIQEGYTFAAALTPFPESFSSVYRATVAAGEQAGNLEQVLMLMAEHIEQQQAQIQRVQQAIIYPALVTGISLLIIIFLLSFVVPKMVEVFVESEQALPLVTTMLLTLSGFIKNYGSLLLICAVLLIYSLKKCFAKWRYPLHGYVLKLWGIGYLSRMVNGARFARNLAILVASGVPLVEGITVASRVVTNLSMQHALLTVGEQVREGKSFHKMLQQTGLFPPLCIYLIANGENTDQLEAMLAQAANQLEGQFTRLVNTLLTLFEPSMIVLMGSIVLFIVLAVLLPIFDLNQLVTI